MKKSFIAKIAVLATAILTIAAWTYANSYKLPEPPQFPNIPEAELTQQGQTVSVAEYELKRAALYDRKDRFNEYFENRASSNRCTYQT